MIHTQPGGGRTLGHSLTLLFALAMVMLGGCQTGPSATTSVSAEPTPAGEPVLVVGTAASAPPMVFRENGEPAGLEIDLAHELAKRLGRKAQIKSMFFPNLSFELRNRRIDIIMAGLSITPKRRLEMAFTDPFLATGQQAMIRSSDAGRFASTNSLDDPLVRIGVETSSTGAAYAAKTFKQAKVIEYRTLADATEALLKREADAVIHDHPSVAWVVQHDKANRLQQLGGLLTTESIAWAVHTGNTELLAQVNAALNEMKADGTLDRLITKWIGGK